MYGKTDFSKSANAEFAEREFRFPKSTFKKLTGYDPSLFIETNEWHHTSKFFNKTKYYCTSEFLEEIVKRQRNDIIENIKKRKLGFDIFEYFIIEYVHSFYFEKNETFENIEKFVFEKRGEHWKPRALRKFSELSDDDIWDKSILMADKRSEVSEKKIHYEKINCKFLELKEKGRALKLAWDKSNDDLDEFKDGLSYAIREARGELIEGEKEHMEELGRREAEALKNLAAHDVLTDELSKKAKEAKQAYNNIRKEVVEQINKELLAKKDKES